MVGGMESRPSLALAVRKGENWEEDGDLKRGDGDERGIM